MQMVFYYENHSVTEIASILRRKEANVGLQLYRTRKLLKEKLGEDFDND